MRSLWFGGGRDDDSKGNAILMIIGIALAILAPIAVRLVGMAISRKREYAADANGVKFVRSPTGLRNALIKIKEEQNVQDRTIKVNKAIAPLFLSNPIKNKVGNLLSSHPPIEKRISILEKM